MLTGLSCAALAVLMVAGVLLDLLLGEARRWHPLVGFGNLASALERRLNQGGATARFRRGIVAWTLAVLPLTLGAALLVWLAAAVNFWLACAVHAAMLYVCLGLRSLRDHNLPIAQALAQGDLAQIGRAHV